jgi:hypothetical protein
MYAAKIVVSKVQRQHRMQLAPFLREAIRQSRHSAHAHSDIEILSLNK